MHKFLSAYLVAGDVMLHHPNSSTKPLTGSGFTAIACARGPQKKIAAQNAQPANAKRTWTLAIKLGLTACVEVKSLSTKALYLNPMAVYILTLQMAHNFVSDSFTVYCVTYRQISCSAWKWCTCVLINPTSKLIDQVDKNLEVNLLWKWEGWGRWSGSSIL